MRLCHETIIEGEMPVRLYQRGYDNFVVLYGKQEHARLNYTDAAKEYGACIMHALCCAGKSDSRTAEEAARDRARGIEGNLA